MKGLRKVIDGVAIKRLRVIPDERGFLMEMLRRDDAIFEGFGQVYITSCKKGVAKAWHYHREQTDHFVCVHGKALVVLYDQREGSPTMGRVEGYVLEAPLSGGSIPPHGRISGLEVVERGTILLKIPPSVVHGFTAIEGEEARIINIPTLPYRYDNPDEYRFPWDSPHIPYRWPSFVKTGG